MHVVSASTLLISVKGERRNRPHKDRTSGDEIGLKEHHFRKIGM